MPNRFTIELSTDDAEFVHRTLNAIMKELGRLGIKLDAETIAQRAVDAVESGERDFDRLRALVLGPEAASLRRPN